MKLKESIIDAGLILFMVIGTALVVTGAAIVFGLSEGLVFVCAGFVLIFFGSLATQS